MEKTLTRSKIFLQLIAIAHIFGGLLLPYLVNTSLFASYNSRLYLALGIERGSQTDINFLTGIFGPTIASWGVLFLYVVTNAFENPNKRGWWAIFFSCAVWAPYDSVLSIQQGIYINALMNLIVALAILVPMFVTRKYFLSS